MSNKTLNLPYVTPLVDPKNGMITPSWQRAFSLLPTGDSSSGGSTSVTWGSITGSIASQTDLFNALAASSSSLGFTPINKAGDSGIGQLVGTSFNYMTGLASATPLMDGIAAVGIGTNVAREDHIHPSDTSKQDALNGTGFVKVSGTTVSFDNSTYYLASNPNGYTTNLGTVTNLSVASANGFSGSVATSTTTPAITLSTSISGLLKGSAGSLVAAVAGTDYQAPIGYTPINKAGDSGIGNLSMGALTATTGTFTSAINISGVGNTLKFDTTGATGSNVIQTNADGYGMDLYMGRGSSCRVTIGLGAANAVSFNGASVSMGALTANDTLTVKNVAYIGGTSTSYTSLINLQTAGSSNWRIGIGDSGGSNFGIACDFGAFTINKTSGNVTTPGSFNGSGSGLTGFAGSLTSGAANVLNTSRLASGSDLNTPTQFQAFDVYAPLNYVISGSWHSVLNWPSNDTSYITQLANMMTGTGEIYRRLKNGGTWGSWYKLIDTSNFTSQALTASQVFTAINNQNNGDWYRTSGGVGIYFSSYSTGLYATASQLIETYNSGSLKVNGTLYATGDVIAYYTSDKRLKENIKPIENAIDKVKLLNGVTYNWNQTYLNSIPEGLKAITNRRDVGLIAQEVEAVLPELVITKETGYKGIKYDRVVALLIEAVKEQQKEIDDLKKRIK
jgi:hypothetical protein